VKQERAARLTRQSSPSGQGEQSQLCWHSSEGRLSPSQWARQLLTPHATDVFSQLSLLAPQVTSTTPLVASTWTSLQLCSPLQSRLQA
jgi:hypothetical protein